MKPEQCCPKFNPKVFDKKTFVWKNKLFLRDDVVQFMHVPLNMGTVITRMCKKIEDAKAMPKTKDFLMLAYDPSPWKSQIYMTVTKIIPDGRMERLSGTFLARVFEGPYNGVPKWFKEMEEYAKSKGKVAKKQYFYFTTCPKCAKKYGKNYVVAFAQV